MQVATVCSLIKALVGDDRSGNQGSCGNTAFGVARDCMMLLGVQI